MKTVGQKHYKQYTLKQLLGSGSFGKVYYSPPYAVKQVNFLGMPLFMTATLKNQILILNQINHPNIVRLIDFFYQGSCVYLVMQYCEQDLDKYLKKNKCDEKKALYIFKQLVLGFRELVNKGIIHRDLKPANILVNSKGEFKLADFGFAKYVDHYENKLLYSIVGTPLYMAPQILNKSQYTTKSDIWSLGFILYQILTGTYPWMGVSEANLYKNITTRPLALPNTISAYAKDLLTKMLQINQKDRISWEELFEMVLQPSYNISPQKRRCDGNGEGCWEKQIKQAGNKQNIKMAEKKKIICESPFNEEKKGQKQKSPTKLQMQNRQKIIAKQKQNKQNSIKQTISQQTIKEIFFIELQRLFDEKVSQKISKKMKNSMTEKEKEQFSRALESFNEEFQKIIKKSFKC